MNNSVTPIDAERHVLSAMLESLEAVWEVTATMRVSDMGEPRHETIAQAIYELATRDEIVGPLAVVDELERTGALNRVGGPAYLYGLHGFTSTPTNAGYYAAMVHETAKRRRALIAAEQIAAAVNDRTINIDVALDNARAALDAAMSDTVTTAKPNPQAEVLAALESIGTARPGFPSRFPDLNQHLHGFRPGALYIVGARPSVGKSALALQFATDLAKFGTVGMFSLEMVKQEIRLRQISQDAEISHHLVTGAKKLPTALYERGRQYAHVSPNIWIDDRGVLTVADVRAQIRTWLRYGELSGVVIDYLQLMDGDSSNGNVQKYTEISRQLKLIAKEFQIPVIALSQLNRNSESRMDKTPMLADLRESGSIEQDADVVLLLHRDVVQDLNNLEIVIAKNRGGQTGMLRYEWQGDFVRAF